MQVRFTLAGYYQNHRKPQTPVKMEPQFSGSYVEDEAELKAAGEKLLQFILDGKVKVTPLQTPNGSNLKAVELEFPGESVLPPVGLFTQEELNQKSLEKDKSVKWTLEGVQQNGKFVSFFLRHYSSKPKELRQFFWGGTGMTKQLKYIHMTKNVPTKPADQRTVFWDDLRRGKATHYTEASASKALEPFNKLIDVLSKQGGYFENVTRPNRIAIP